MTRRLLLIALALGLLPFAVGCDELTKGNEKKPTEGGTADKPVPKTKYSSEHGDFSTADPLIGNAVQSRQQLAEQEEALLERLDEIRTLLGSAKADPERMRKSVEEFLALAQEIRKVVAKTGDSLAYLDESTRDLARSMKHLGNSYRATAGLFRSKARDYAEPKLREHLNAFADDYEAIGKTIPERVKALQEFQKTLPKWKAKVREANAFLDDAVLYLSAHPGTGPDPRER